MTFNNIGELTVTYHRLIQYMIKEGWEYRHKTRLWHLNGVTMTTEKALWHMERGDVPLPF